MPAEGGESSETAVVDQAIDELLAEYPPTTTDPKEFLNAQFDAGLAWVHFPVGHGGRELSRGMQSRVYHRLQEVNAPSATATNPLGYSMGAPTVMAWGTDTQKQRYMRKIFTGEERWCQLFSEPGAGSDLAGVATRAVRDGDEWVITGQKVWNTMAHLSDIGMLVARTDPEKVKHQGLTYFAIDMHAPGVEVRPLRQMTGDAEFNEVYLTEVRVPDACRLGDVGDGWKVSLATLMNERVMFTSDHMEIGPINQAIDLFQAIDSPAPEHRARLIDLFIRSRVLRLSNARASANMAAGTPGPEASTGKIGFSDINQLGYELCVDLMGAEGLLFDSYEMHQFGLEELEQESRPAVDARRRFLRSRANSIEGGTSEIMRNILAERILGLPGEHRVDKDRPFSQVPRN